MFFQVDDKFHSNRKVVDMIDEEGVPKAGPAVMLWTLAGSLARDSGLDGVISLGRARRVMGGNEAAAKRAAALLVKHGLWHAPGHACEKCPPVDKGTWLFHQWFQFRYGTGAAEREAVARRQELRDPAIVEAVWARDTDAQGVPHCRYCGIAVERPERGSHGGKRRATNVGQLDHVDPTRAIGATNIVLACPTCNQKKAQRTPEQAGMKLLDPPAPAPAPTSETPQILCGKPSENGGNKPIDQDGDQVAIKTGSSSEVCPPRARARGGAGGAWVGPGSGGVGSGTGRAGAAPHIETPAAFGSPWKDHHGPPPPDEVIAQATCPEHNLPRPCRACAQTPYQNPTGGPA